MGCCLRSAFARLQIGGSPRLLAKVFPRPRATSPICPVHQISTHSCNELQWTNQELWSHASARRKAGGEALTGVLAGRAIELRNHHIRVADLVI